MKCVDYTLSVAITRHGESDDLLVQALTSLAAQKDVKARILVLDQQISTEIKKFCSRTYGKVSFEYDNIDSCGIAQARNEAIKRCKGGIILFTEPDATAHPDWAAKLGETLNGGATVAGGRILPRWARRPPIITRSALVQDLYSLLDLGEGIRLNNKVIGCNFGINLSKLNMVSPIFHRAYGRHPGTLMGGEEIELCRRVLCQGGEVIYDGRAIVDHHIGHERCSYRWLLRRIYAAGCSRALLGGMPNPTNRVKKDRYTAIALPFYCFYLVGYVVGQLQTILKKAFTGERLKQ